MGGRVPFSVRGKGTALSTLRSGGHRRRLSPFDDRLATVARSRHQSVIVKQVGGHLQEMIEIEWLGDEHDSPGA